MLRFRLHQLHLPSIGAFFLPLPKLAKAQIEGLSSNLQARGFKVKPGGETGKIVATRGATRISIDGRLGLARSREDMLDALAPSVPEVLAAGRVAAWPNASGRYFVLSTSEGKVRIRLSPRLESVRTWTCLRKDGLCGLTPDEAAVIKRILGCFPKSAVVGCVTSKPGDASEPFQVGNRRYYSTSIPVSEFVSTLGTVESVALGSASFLPRSSTLTLPGRSAKLRLGADDLGEWCFE